MERKEEEAMAKKIVAFVGSPRKGGNTDTLVSQMLSAAEKAGAKTEKVYLGDMKINPCKACDACRKVNPPKCVQKDDFAAAAEKMIAADAIIFGTPVYWWTMSAQSKPFMDRWYGLLDKDYSSPFKGKGVKAAVVVCCEDKNTKGMTDPIIHTFQESFKFLGIDLIGHVAASAHKKGEVANNKEAMEKAAEVGRKLAT